MTIHFDIAQDSRSPGVLTESASNFQEPEDILRLFCCAITGIDKTLVRKRWLMKPGSTPPVGVDWCALGVESVETHGTPVQHGSKPQTDKDPDVITRTSVQTLRCRASFYGAHASSVADTFREGIQLSQNRSQLERYGLKLQAVDDEVRHVPDYAFSQWIDRYDITFKVGRSVTRTFGVRTIVDATDIELITERGKLK
jgi:hypothetical protein